MISVKRREYPIKISINGRSINKVIIDTHYEEKHKGSVSDEIILKLIVMLDQRAFDPVKTRGEFEYYVEDKMRLDQKFYKLIWILHESEVFVGVINCYRRN